LTNRPTIKEKIYLNGRVICLLCRQNMHIRGAFLWVAGGNEIFGIKLGPNKFRNRSKNLAQLVENAKIVKLDIHDSGLIPSHSILCV
jgi:hypothetical protein